MLLISSEDDERITDELVRIIVDVNARAWGNTKADAQPLMQRTVAATATTTRSTAKGITTL
eukprot:CAMPEP_0201888672 /NCGR_PEP_ID=MMETSP0902-20130614/28159_1 /ASSEMBLY_ACC=CAM_ASM_000551 /TAXON_ID=420261 /ORGANISM="Thalassiosira antarctica, Strain CCMP982" /LENGTH=60 /DNA_ID=CAMNT_0048418989 /DNA_START=53 /DNA_END=235 /DNA_ORIENTATION=-